MLYIFQTHKPYTERLDYLTQLLNKTRAYEGTKFYIDHKDIDEKTLLMYWGSAYETLYISATQSPDSTRSIYIVTEPKETSWITDRKKNFFTIFDNIEYDKVHKRYFNFQDTTRGYRMMNDE